MGSRRVDFGLKLGQLLSVLGEQLADPCQREARGLVSCQHQRYRLIAQLLIGHLRAGLRITLGGTRQNGGMLVA